MLSESQATQIAKALGDRVRLQTFTEIARTRQICAGQLEVCNVVSKATISHHLRILTQAGLVLPMRNGQYIGYRAIPKRIHEYCLYLSTLANPSATRRRKTPAAQVEKGRSLH